MAKTVTVHPLSVSGHVKQARRASKRRAVTYGVDNPAPGVRVDPVPMEGLRTIRQYAVTHQADGTPIEKGMAKMDVLRMSVRKQFVGGGGNHLPSMLVKKHSKDYGPVARRPARSKRKRGPAPGNLCHRMGLGNPVVECEAKLVRRKLNGLRKAHILMLDKKFSDQRYWYIREQLLRLHPHLRAKVEWMEREHWLGFIPRR